MTKLVNVRDCDIPHLLWLDLNDDRRRNALTEDLLCELIDHLEEADANSDTRAVVLGHQGTAFSSGGDVTKMRSDDSFEIYESLRTSLHRSFRLIHALEVPLVAVLNGPAVGAGMDLALLCDFRLATAKARLRAAFRDVGLSPPEGGSWLLQKFVPYDVSFDILTSGRWLEAKECVRRGLFTDLIPGEDLMAEVGMRLRGMLGCPTSVSRMIKTGLRDAQGGDGFDRALLLGRMGGGITGTGEAHKGFVDGLAIGDMLKRSGE